MRERSCWRVLVFATGALMLALPSCRSGHVEPGPGGGIVVKSDRLGWYTKKVVTKQPPETLFAEDGTICRLSPSGSATRQSARCSTATGNRQTCVPPYA